jgi:hypothetical protein
MGATSQSLVKGLGKAMSGWILIMFQDHAVCRVLCLCLVMAGASADLVTGT